MEEEIIVPEEETFDYNKLRYILDKDGYICHASIGGLIVCDLGECTEYNGTIPDGYETIAEWHEGEIEKLNAWKIVKGNLIFDEIKYNKLQEQCKQDEIDNSCVTHKELYGLQKEVEDMQNINSTQYTKEIANGKIVCVDDVKKVYPKIKMTNIDCYDYEQVDIIVNKKNMLPNEAVTQTINGVTFTQNKDRSITISGIATENTYFDLAGTNDNIVPFLVFKKDTNYYLSTDNFKLEFYYFDGTDTELVYSGKDGIVKFDVDKKVTNIKIVIDKEYEELPLIYDDETGKYYVDGVSTQKIVSGKQLFNYKDTNAVTTGITVDEDGWITVSCDNTNETSIKFFNYFTNNLNLKPSTNYLIVTEIKNVIGAGEFAPVTKTWVTPQTQGQFTSTVQLTFDKLTSNTINTYVMTTVDEGINVTNGLRSYVRFNAGENGSITFRLSVIEDTSITSDNFIYEEYTGGKAASPNPDYPQEIINKYKAGTYQVSNGIDRLLVTLTDDLKSTNGIADRLWVNFTKKTCELNVNVSTKIFNGSETGWSVVNGSTGINQFNLSVPDLKIRSGSDYKNNVTCTHFGHISYWGNSWLVNNVAIQLIGENRVRLQTDKIATLDEFKAWLSENNTTIYYELATPIIETIQLVKTESNTIYPILNLGTEPIEYEEYEAQRLSINFSEFIKDGLFPSDELYPSDDLFPKGTTIDYLITENSNKIISVNGKKDDIDNENKIGLFDGFNMIYCIQDVDLEIEYCINNLKLEGTVTKNNNFKVLDDGSIEAHNGFFSGILKSESGEVGGWHIGETSLWCEIKPPYDYSQNDLNRITQIISGDVTATEEDYLKYDFDKDKIISLQDMLVVQKLIRYNLKNSKAGKLILDTSDWFRPIKIINSNNEVLASFGISGVIVAKEEE